MNTSSKRDRADNVFVCITCTSDQMSTGSAALFACQLFPFPASAADADGAGCVLELGARRAKSSGGVVVRGEEDWERVCLAVLVAHQALPTALQNSAACVDDVCGRS